jgi:tRNA (cytidine/uridine-2'-O-)-methyltransferase
MTAPAPPSGSGAPAALPPTEGPRLRAGRGLQPFQVVLVEPEIPPNTGNIARLCAATRARLHLVEPLGFRIDEHSVRRAGLDYWPLVQLETHADFAAARRSVTQLEPGARCYLFTGKAARSYLDVRFRPGDALVFGKESQGLPEALLAEHQQDLVGIPTLGPVRSLNLANAVAIALYEALRQVGELEGAELG